MPTIAKALKSIGKKFNASKAKTATKQAPPRPASPAPARPGAPAPAAPASASATAWRPGQQKAGPRAPGLSHRMAPAAAPAPAEEELEKEVAEVSEKQTEEKEDSGRSDPPSDERQESASAVEENTGSSDTIPSQEHASEQHEEEKEEEEKGEANAHESAKADDSGVADPTSSSGNASEEEPSEVALPTDSTQVPFHAQAEYKGEGVPEAKATLQRNLREGAATHLKDADEVYRDADGKRQTSAVNRLALSETEKASKGWALMGLRDHYKHDDALKGAGGMFNTTYLFDELADLEHEAAKELGSKQEKGREQTVLQFVDGKWTNAGEAVHTKGADANQQAINDKAKAINSKAVEVYKEKQAAEKAGADQATLDDLQKRFNELEAKLKLAVDPKTTSAGGNWIFVMNAAGTFFAAKAQQWIIHHSSFLAGGAAAAAGEIGISGGTVTFISNTSGHYRPGPAYLWQAVKQLESQNVPMGSLKVKVMGVPISFRSGQEFLDAFNPAEDPTMFDSGKAVAHLTEKAKQAKAARPPKPKKNGEAETAIKT